MDPSAPDVDPEVASDREPPTGDILVVDDNHANLVSIQAALGDFDGRIVHAQSGSEALGHLLERDFALVLLDVKMPLMDGLETARMIRGRKRSRHTPIIFITAYDRDDSEVLAAYELGAVDFLFKPLVAEVLQAKVSVFVELHRRTAKVALQAGLLREHEHREHERALETERRRWESESLRRQMEELEAADHRKDDFLALLGHELRNPLAPLVAGVELIREKLKGAPSVDPEVLHTCARMQRQTEHLIRLVDDLLDISRVNSGKVELRKSVVSIQEIVEQALTTSRPFIDKRRHEVSVDVPSDALLVRGDVVRLVQTIANLLNNAARYTEPGGSIHITCQDAGEWIEISVTDSGRGIAPEFLPRVFDRFVQEYDAKGGGLGLGLTLAAQLVGLHGGTITAFSDGPGRGSRFTVRLPSEKPAPVEATRKKSSIPPPAKQGKPLVIALVDDHPDIRELMQELLLMWGHTVEVAKNGEKGIELINRLRPHVAFVDIGLPDMDGYDVATSVRQTLGRDGLRLIAMTGFGRDSDRRLSREAGFDVHLVKPVDMDSLKKVLTF